MNTKIGVYLDKIVLVNWSLHSLQVYDHISTDGAVLAGENGSGKTTTLDAILTVLLGSTSEKNYNQAAAAKSENARNFRNYVLGKKEGCTDKGVREGCDFTTHLLLTFYDSLASSYITCGMCCDYHSQSAAAALNPNFYIYEGDFDQSLIIDDEQAMNVHETKLAMSQASSDGRIRMVRFFNTRREYQEALFLRMRIDGALWTNSIRNLVSLNKDMKIDDFIFTYLCGGDDCVSADRMNDVLNNWAECQADLKQAQERMEVIGKELELYQSWVDACRDERVARLKVELVAMRDAQKSIKEAEKKQQKFEAERLSYEQRHKNLSDRISALRAEQSVKQLALDSDDKASARSNILRRIDHLTSEAESLRGIPQRRYEDIVAALNRLESCLADCKFDWGDVSDDVDAYRTLLQELNDEGAGIFGSHADDLRKLISLADSIINHIDDIAYDLKDRKRALVKKAEDDQAELKLLASGEVRPAWLTKLMSFIKSEADCKVTILAEAIDIKSGEDTWRGAVEGVLGPRRLNLIVEPSAYDRAWEAFKRYRGQKNTRLVNTSEVARFYESARVAEDSLARKIDVTLPWAYDAVQAYVIHLVGDIHCVDDTLVYSHVNPNGRAVTSSGDRYEGFSLFEIPSNMLYDSMVGSAARRIRAEQRSSKLRRGLADAAREQTDIDLKISNLSNVRKAFLGSDSGFGYELAEAIDAEAQADTIDSEVAGLNDALDDIDVSESEELIRDIAKLTTDIASLEQQVNDAIEKKSAASTKVDDCHLSIENANQTCQRAQENLLKLESIFYTEEQGTVSCKEIELVLAQDGIVGKSASNIDNDCGAKAAKCEERWNALLKYRDANRDAVRRDSIVVEAADNDSWQKEWDHLDKALIPEARALVADIEKTTKESFTTDIVAAMRNGFKSIFRAIREANRALSAAPFGDIHYRFEVRRLDEFRNYYDMIMDRDFENTRGGLWDSLFYGKYGDLVDRFFEAIRDSSLGESERVRNEASAMKRALLDFKSYLAFDMVEERDSGSKTYLRAGIGGGSTGEQLLPFYIILFSSMQKVCHANRGGMDANTLRCVMIDEAFDRIDDPKTVRSIRLMQQMGLQPIMAVPGAARTPLLAKETGSFYYHVVADKEFYMTRFVETDGVEFVDVNE